MLIEPVTQRLRRWRDSDRAPFVAMNADAAVMEFFRRGWAAPKVIRLSIAR